MSKKPSVWMWRLAAVAVWLSGCGGQSGSPAEEDSESATQDTATEDTATQDTVTQDTATEDTATQDTVTQDTATEDTATQDTVTQDTVTQDTATQDTATQDTVTQDTVTQDTVTQDTVTQDTATEDTATQDTVTQDSDSVTFESDTPTELQLRLDRVQPPSSSRELALTLTLTGELFTTGMTVEIRLSEGEPIALGTAVVAPEGTSATVELPADPTRPQGLYDVTVRNPDLDEDTLPGALLVSADPPPVLTDVEPALAWSGDPLDEVLSDRSVRLLGSGFINTPWVTFVSATDPGLAFDAAEVHFVDAQTLVAVVPSESQSMPAGNYHVWVSNPDTLSAQWLVDGTLEPGVLVVTDTPPPRITEIGPVQWPFMTLLAPFIVRGEHFQDGATIELLGPQAAVALTPVEFVSVLELSTSIGASVVTVGLYPVRVTNPDGQSDVFYAYEAKNGTDGHFSEDFSLLEVTLQQARDRLAAEVGFDAYGAAHVYAVGGIDEAQAVRSDVEEAAVSTHGELAAFEILQQWGSAASPRIATELETPRQGHALLRVGKWLYAIGGSSSPTKGLPASEAFALSTVERAEILHVGTQPVAQKPTRLGDGNLPVGTWYYRVSALGEWGEGLASAEVQLLNQGGSLEVCWTAVEGAVSYNLYRSSAADGRAGSTRLLATEQLGPCFVDDGALHPAPGFVSASALPGGALGLGRFTYRLTSLVGGEESVAGYAASVVLEAGNGSVELSWTEVPGATYNVYRVESATDDPTALTTLLASGLSETSWVDLGDLSPSPGLAPDEGHEPLSHGSLGLWTTLVGELNEGREGAGAAVVPADSDDGSVLAYLYVAGGRPDSSGQGYLSSVEVAAVFDDGELGPWTALSATPMTGPRAFFPLASTWGRGVTQVSAGGDELTFETGAEPSVEEPVYLIAFQGDAGFSTPSNDGLISAEAALVDRTTGALAHWYDQPDGQLVNGRRTHGHQAALIDDYAYCLPGVDTETAGGEPMPLSSNTSRFPLDVTPAAADEVLDNYMAANAEFLVRRSYYALVRVSGSVFVLGGNDGLGAIASVERVPQ
ncbi:MAG: hypothetical protein MUC50_01740 [Myxococcota bacterium]|jgi:hypothetical protein|nr:hypothetical protein [Myxococcota bacterium]